MRRHSIVLRAGLVTLLAMVGSSASAQDFALQVGPPIAGAAGSAQPAKKSVLVVRPGGCADPARVEIRGTAEGIVNGARQTVPLKLTALPTPGVHALERAWPNGGIWVINLAGTCAGKTAGAIVSMGTQEIYKRDLVKFLSHHATPAEIDASLKALTTGGQQ
jgi:hypothetical protein